MCTGIYKLVFKGTDKVYIGQSIDIERRFKEHTRKLMYGKASPKLQDAANIFGLPSLEIVTECSMPELNATEVTYIAKYNSLHNGFNSTIGGANLPGVNSFTAKYTEDDYYNVLLLLGTEGVAIKDIHLITGVSKPVIYSISAKESNLWLKHTFPNEYELMEKLPKRFSAYLRGVKYPSILSPSGQLHEVTCVSQFAKEHSLDAPTLHKVLSGLRTTHKGWVLSNTAENIDSKRIMDPDGGIHNIPYRGIKDFANRHTLHYPSLVDLLAGKQKIHRGWKLPAQ